ncbi:MAG: RHS repeat protein [Deltaproteobacteria bacterium]|nr:RHS repeat protein [Deltaproteobacteria bacterium]
MPFPAISSSPRFPDTGTTRYAYDASGNLISRSDARGITITYDYDALNHLTAIHFPDSNQDITPIVA